MNRKTPKSGRPEQDATLRNVRATAKRITALENQQHDIADAVTVLQSDVLTLQASIKILTTALDLVNGE